MSAKFVACCAAGDVSETDGLATDSSETEGSEIDGSVYARENL